MNTTFLLLAQYGARAIIPIEDVCRDYFRHMTPQQLARKAQAGERLRSERYAKASRA